MKDHILSDFHKEENRLRRIALNTKWYSRTICIHFNGYICARFDYKEDKFIELSYILNEGIKYIKL